MLGPRGRSSLTALVAGSFSHAAINKLGCPVLVVPPDAGSADVREVAGADRILPALELEQDNDSDAASLAWAVDPGPQREGG